MTRHSCAVRRNLPQRAEGRWGDTTPLGDSIIPNPASEKISFRQIKTFSIGNRGRMLDMPMPRARATIRQVDNLRTREAHLRHKSRQRQNIHSVGTPVRYSMHADNNGQRTRRIAHKARRDREKPRRRRIDIRCLSIAACIDFYP